MRSLSLLLLVGCATASRPPAGDLTRWRAHLRSPGGELAFSLVIAGDRAWIENGVERAPFSKVEWNKNRLLLELDWYDSRIVAERRGDRLEGTWSKTVPSGRSELPFIAVLGDAPRYAGQPPKGDVGGFWRVTFQDDDGPYAARGELTQSGPTVTGTFLTETGDYRFLEGRLDGDTLVLSCFDGAHAFLFRAKLSGDTLDGDFWSRDTYHATWTGTRVASREEAPLADPYGLASIVDEERRFDFSFSDLAGNTVSAADFSGRPMLIDIFGSWCPNCNDQAPVLAEWHRTFGPKGLVIVGLAFEFTGDVERDRRVLSLYAARHGIEFPILLAGTSDKKKAAATLDDLDAVVAYPTTILVRRDGTVHKVHTGWAGPGTGDNEKRMITELEREIRALLAPAAPNR